jgi:hypothetical protein
MNPPHWPRRAMRLVQHPRPLRFRKVGSHGQRPPAILFDLVGSQHFERILMVSVNYRRDRMQWYLSVHSGLSLLR